MLDLASQIVKAKEGHFDPSKFEDRYEDALKELLEKKQEGKPIERPERRAPTNVVNLMDALRRNVEASWKSTAARKKRPHRALDAARPRKLNFRNGRRRDKPAKKARLELLEALADPTLPCGPSRGWRRSHFCGTPIRSGEQMAIVKCSIMEISQCRAQFNTPWNENAMCSADGAGCCNEPLDRVDALRMNCCWVHLHSLPRRHRETPTMMIHSMTRRKRMRRKTTANQQ
jgi:hypothetical protein